MKDGFDWSILPDKNAIENAYQRIIPYVKKTPVLSSSAINQISETDIVFKCENFQKAGAFKFRGATNAIIKLDAEQKKSGVCTHSSGNHAQALALAAYQRKIPAYIVMPNNAPAVKVNAVKNYHGIITFCEPTLEAREATLKKVQEQTNSVFIHPYDNIDIIEGQATCSYELLFQLDQEPDIIVCPVGGGGLLSGTLLGSYYFSPETQVIAAEPLNANDAWQSWTQNKFVPAINTDTIADGLKTSLGCYTWPVVQKYVSQILTVSEEAIIEAMYLILERMKIIIEPSSAVVLAAIIKNPAIFQNKKVAVILSGGNVDLMKLPWMKSS